jgi:hypothetical protein
MDGWEVYRNIAVGNSVNVVHLDLSNESTLIYCDLITNNLSLLLADVELHNSLSWPNWPEYLS